MKGKTLVTNKFQSFNVVTGFFNKLKCTLRNDYFYANVCISFHIINDVYSELNSVYIKYRETAVIRDLHRG